MRACRDVILLKRSYFLSDNLFGLNISTTPIVIQYGTANPNTNVKHQNAINPITKNNAIPNETAIIVIFGVKVLKF